MRGKWYADERGMIFSAVQKRIPGWEGGWCDAAVDPAGAIALIPPTHVEHYQQI